VSAPGAADVISDLTRLSFTRKLHFVMRIKNQNPIDRHVGARIRMQRMVCGLSQTKLGKAVGVSFQQVQKYEKGVNRVGASRLQQIANVLRLRQISFLTERRQRPSLTYPRRLRSSKDLSPREMGLLCPRRSLKSAIRRCDAASSRWLSRLLGSSLIPSEREVFWLAVACPLSRGIAFGGVAVFQLHVGPMDRVPLLLFAAVVALIGALASERYLGGRPGVAPLE
jgi:DNA-binding XRE family transcriptional regulator